MKSRPIRTDLKRLKDTIHEKGYNYRRLADECFSSLGVIGRKMAGMTPFTEDDRDTLITVLQLTDEEIENIFDI